MLIAKSHIDTSGVSTALPKTFEVSPILNFEVITFKLDVGSLDRSQYIREVSKTNMHNQVN